MCDNNDIICLLIVYRRIKMGNSWIQRAKKLMHDRHVTQADLAVALGKKTRGTVGHYFTKRSEPSLSDFKAMAKHFGVSLNFLLSGEVTETAIDKQKLSQCMDAVNAVMKKNNIELDTDQQAKLVAYLYAETPDNEEVSTSKAFDLANIFA